MFTLDGKRYGQNSDQNKELSERIRQDLDLHTADKHREGRRSHLGGSIIGRKCARNIWYSFRWARDESYVDKDGVDQRGRMMRLFNRGHNAEFRFVGWLRGMGFTVEEFDPKSRLYWDRHTEAYSVGTVDDASAYTKDVTGNDSHEATAASQGVKRKQLQCSGVNGHFGGSLDGIVEFPAKYGVTTKMLVEFKTFSAKNFKKLKDNGVRVEKPEHYAQMHVYAVSYDLPQAMYLAINKDNDEVYVEVVDIDINHYNALLKKAEMIVNAAVPPKREAPTAAFQVCRFCNFTDICHYRAKLEKNCRTCQFAVPVENAAWVCKRVEQTIPREFMLKGCDGWVQIEAED